MFGALLIENFIFNKFYGCCPFLGVSDKPATALGMGMAVTFVMTVSGAATYAVYHFLLEPFGLEYLRTIAFILVIAALVQFIEMFLRKFVPALYCALGIYLPLITTNCAVMSSALLIIDNSYGFIEGDCFGFDAGLGFTLAIVGFCPVCARAFKTLISARFFAFSADAHCSRFCLQWHFRLFGVLASEKAEILQN